jgi:hypothetical protein
LGQEEKTRSVAINLDPQPGIGWVKAASRTSRECKWINAACDLRSFFERFPVFHTSVSSGVIIDGPFYKHRGGPLSIIGSLPLVPRTCLSLHLVPCAVYPLSSILLGNAGPRLRSLFFAPFLTLRAENRRLWLGRGNAPDFRRKWGSFFRWTFFY